VHRDMKNIKHMTNTVIFYSKWTFIWSKDKSLCLMSILKAVKLWLGLLCAIVFIVLTAIDPAISTLSMFFIMAVAYLLFYMRYEKIIYKLENANNKLGIVLAVTELFVMFNIGWLLAQTFSEGVVQVIIDNLAVILNVTLKQSNYGLFDVRFLFIPLFLPVFTCKFYTRKSFIISIVIAVASLVVSLVSAVIWGGIFLWVCYGNILSVVMLIIKKKDVDNWKIIDKGGRSFLVTNADVITKKKIYKGQAVGRNNFIYQEKYSRKYCDIFKRNNINSAWNNLNNYVISDYSAKEKRIIKARRKRPRSETSLPKMTFVLLLTSYVFLSLSFLIRYYFLNPYVSVFMFFGVIPLVVSTLCCWCIFIISRKAMKNSMLSEYYERFTESKKRIYLLYGFTFIGWVLYIYLLTQSILPANLLPPI